MVRIQAFFFFSHLQISQEAILMQGGTGCCYQQLWMGRFCSRQETDIPTTSPRPDAAAVFESKWSPG